jgi:hypothetical protein
VFLTNSVTGNQTKIELTNNTPSFGTTQAQMLTGDFNGDGLDDAPTVYASRSADPQDPTHAINKFGMRIGVAVDVNTVDSGLTMGPRI